MLHEILLSLSGHPSPLLRSASDPSNAASSIITPPERQLLAQAAHLSDLNIKLITSTAQTSAAHPSPVCRAVASAIDSIHLAAFQRKILEVEEGILQQDPEYVGAYNIVPLTTVMGEFMPWRRRMEWLWGAMRYMMRMEDGRPTCGAAQVIDWLRRELKSGFRDIEDTALSLVAAAETAWLKQASAWVLYGRLPNLGGQDFFVKQTTSADGVEEFHTDRSLLPVFVTTRTAESMLFIGKSLNHVRVKKTIESGVRGLDQLSSKLRELSSLTFPLQAAHFSRAVTSIRLLLSETTLQKILPVTKVVEMLQLLRQFFLLGRGEFAMALTQEADEKIRSRWKRADNLAYDKREGGLKNITIKEGEVAAVLARTWTVLVSTQGLHAEEDEQLELARDLFQLHLVKQAPSPAAITPGPGLSRDAIKQLVDSPFRNLLFSVPASLSMQLPSPLDMVLSPSDLYLYSCINSYLLSMRRAHLRLTDLWKITSLRRHHPAPRGADEHVVELRERWSSRMALMRSSWTTASAAIFLLAETEGYFQMEIVAGLWDHFHTFLTVDPSLKQASDSKKTPEPAATHEDEDGEDDDIWLQDDVETQARPTTEPEPYKPSTHKAPHDPQTLSTAHALYLHTLVHRLLLTQGQYTEELYKLLVHIDHLVAHTQRLHSIFTAIDLETDAGVVDAFVDLHAEEAEVTALLRGVEGKVKHGIRGVVSALRALEADPEFIAAWEGEGRGSGMHPDEDDNEDDISGGSGGGGGLLGDEALGYVPARVGSISRLLMKLDFGTWLGVREDDA